MSKKNKTYTRIFTFCIAFFLIILFYVPASSADGQTYSFTTCTQTGRTGPSQAQVNTAYTGTNLENNVTINTQGIQEWTVPVTGYYNITAAGAEGGQGFSGKGLGATISGHFYLVENEVLNIIVGQKGEDYSDQGGGGGGGSFIWKDVDDEVILVAGGGGGGSDVGTIATYSHGQADTTGGNYDGTTTIGQGGAAGAGDAWDGGGGAGWNSSGASVDYNGYQYGQGGTRPLDGGYGGETNTYSYDEGGFGGGGSNGYDAGGGGGGYTGGRGGDYRISDHQAGGGGSYNKGINQINTAGVNSGSGFVNITFLYESGPSPPVPEPSIIVLFVSGCLFLAFITLKKTK